MATLRPVPDHRRLLVGHRPHRELMAQRGLGRPWRRTVARVIRRDAGICWICGQPGADTADHVIPRSQGGPDTMDNLRSAHHVNPPHCNRIRGARSVEYAQSVIGRAMQPSDDWDW